jgi:hypothetical protein
MEDWKQIKDFENYLISKNGEIKNKYGRLLKCDINNKGYRTIRLCKNGKKIHTTLHRLIAIAFIDNPYNFSCIDHINGNKLDNRIENIRWVSHSQNNQNRILRTGRTGERNIILNKFNKFDVEIRYQNLRLTKRCRTLDEAKQWRNTKLLEHNIINYRRVL